jgi:geranylgeranyl reductase family protein
MEWDVLIVGGGPAGLLASREIARSGRSVLAIEEHQEIGYPVQCSGLFSLSGLEALDLSWKEGLSLSTIRGGRFYSPGGRELLAYSPRDRAVVVERKLFDKELAREAVAAGAEIRLKTQALDLEVGEEGVRLKTRGLKGEEILSAPLLIAADGMRSNIARRLGMKTPRKTIAAAQVEVEEVDLEGDVAEVYFGKRVAPNFYAWILPKGEVYEVGVGVRGGETGPRGYLRRFLREHPIATRKVRGRSVLEMNQGGFPVDLPGETVSERVMIVGDAAAQTKASTGGGVITGGIAARLAGQAAVKALEEGTYSRAFLREEYERRWKEELGGELESHLFLRRILDSLTDDQLEEIFLLAEEEDVPSLMVRYRDTDRPSQFLKELLGNPRILSFFQRVLDRSDVLTSGTEDLE